MSGLREISLKSCEKIGQGLAGAVYALDDERIVKVAYGKDQEIMRRRMQHELSVAQELVRSGIPTPQAYEMVIADGNTGVIYERLKGESLMDYIQLHPEEIEGLAGKVSDILHKLHSTVPKIPNLPDMKAEQLALLPMMESFYSKDQLNIIKSEIEEVPDRNTFLHGDMNPGNIMILEDGTLKIIDVGTVSTGDPYFEFASIIKPFYYLEDIDYGKEEAYAFCAKMLGEADIKKLYQKLEILKEFNNKLIEKYYESMPEDDRKDILEQIWTRSYGKVVTFYARLPLSDEKKKQENLEKLKQKYFRMKKIISVDGCKVIGRGTYGTVYRLDDERIVKVFNTQRKTSYERIVQEKQIAREVFIHDIPTAISFDIVRVGNDYGIVFEQLYGDTLMSYLAQNPDKRQEMTEKLCRILKKLHTTEIRIPGLFKMRDILLGMTEIVRPLFDEAGMNTVRGIFANVPEQNTMIHGDFHPGNVIIKDDGELMLIDVGDLSVGHPFYEFFNMYPSFLQNSEIGYGLEFLEGKAKSFLGAGSDEELTERKEFFAGYWRELLQAYFEEEHVTEIAGYFDAIGRFKLLASYMNTPFEDEEKKHSELEKLKEHFLDGIKNVPPVKEWWCMK